MNDCLAGASLREMFAPLMLLHLAAVPTTISLDVDGVHRSALVFAPRSGAGPSPLLFGFHGHGGDSYHVSRSFDLQDAWPEAIVVYPQGLPAKTFFDREGLKTGWLPDADNQSRDIRFFDALFAALKARYKVDSRRVYAMGHSNGGQFMYTLWATRGSVFAALASCEAAGANRVRLTPKPFFVTIGDQDTTVPVSWQRRSLAEVFRVSSSASTGPKFGECGVEYPGKCPVVLWSYHGGHAFPRDCVPTMISFFRSVGT